MWPFELGGRVLARELVATQAGVVKRREMVVCAVSLFRNSKARQREPQPACFLPTAGHFGDGTHALGDSPFPKCKCLEQCFFFVSHAKTAPGGKIAGKIIFRFCHFAAPTPARDEQLKPVVRSISRAKGRMCRRPPPRERVIANAHDLTHSNISRMSS